MGAKTIRSFNADSEINEIIKESNVKKGELSTWINDKIKKGVIYDKNPISIPMQAQEVRNMRLKV